MDVILPIGGAPWVFDLTQVTDWTVPATTHGPQTQAFGLRPATSTPVDIGGGRQLRVQDGGSVNCADLHLNAHGAGTHTECIGHVSLEGREIHTLQIPALLPATVLSVVPVRLGTTTDTYGGQSSPDDRVVPVAPLARAFSELTRPGYDAAIVLRTREEDEPARCWSGQNPPYLTHEAMAFLAASSA